MKRSEKFFIIHVLSGCAAGGSTTPTPSPGQTGSFQPVVRAAVPVKLNHIPARLPWWMTAFVDITVSGKLCRRAAW